MITKDIEELSREKLLLETDIAQKEADIKIRSGEIKSLQVQENIIIRLSLYFNIIVLEWTGHTCGDFKTARKPKGWSSKTIGRSKITGK